MSKLLLHTVLTIVLLLGMGMLVRDRAEEKNGNGVQAHGALHVTDNQLLDEEDEVVVLRGMSSHGITWYPRYLNGASMKTLSEHGANLQRFAVYTEIKGGYLEDREESLNYLYMGVESALEADMYAIIDWHILTDNNPLEYQEEAKEFFEEVSSQYKDSSAILYEICNEPNGETTWADIKKYAEAVIPVIRANDPDAVVLVGTPKYCTDFTDVKEDPLKFDNIMYVYHRYVDVSEDIPCDNYLISDIVKSGLPIFVTEWGTALNEQAYLSEEEDISMEETVAYQEAALPFLEYMEEHNISWAAWALSNKDEMHSVIRSDCNKYSDWLPEDLTDFGRFIFEHF